MASDSMNERDEKHQQVPVLAWFFTEVMGFSFTTVNLKPSLSSGLGGMGPPIGGCAVAAILMSARAKRRIFFISEMVLMNCLFPIHKYKKTH